MKVETRFAVTAFIDLLGFSSHLALASNDVRTAIGEMAIRRLKNLEQIEKLIKTEKTELKQCYPTTEIHSSRFNDALFITMEMGEQITSEIGQSGWNSSPVERMKRFQKHLSSKSAELLAEFEKEAENVAKFLGLIARIHFEINALEREGNFPGARTVVATGRKVIDTENPLDSFSANFSVSNAYIVGELGSKGGFGGNEFYVDDTVAEIVSICNKNQNLMRLSNLFPSRIDKGPYSVDRYGNKLQNRGEVKEARIVSTKLFEQTYTFRSLNIIPLTWIQVMHYILDEIGVENYKKSNADVQYLISTFKELPNTIESIQGESYNAFFTDNHASFKPNAIQESFGINSI